MYSTCFMLTYSKMIGDTIIRIHATKNITVVTVMPDAIFAWFNILWDFPRNGHLTRSQYHGSSRPLKSKSAHISDCDLLFKNQDFIVRRNKVVLFVPESLGHLIIIIICQNGFMIKIWSSIRTWSPNQRLWLLATKLHRLPIALRLKRCYPSLNYYVDDRRPIIQVIKLSLYVVEQLFHFDLLRLFQLCNQ